MIALDETRGIDEVRAANGIENIVDGNAGSEKARRFGRHLEFRDAATLNQNGGDAIEPVYAWLEVVGGNFPELILWNRVRGQAVTKDWERGEGEAVRFDLGRGRQFRLQAGNDSVDALQRKNHVAVPVKKKIDLRGTAAGDGLHFLQ